MPAAQMVADVSRWLHSWANYFRHGYPRRAFRHVNRFAMQRLTRRLQRRSQRGYRPANGQSFYAQLQTLVLQLL
jgi:Group II intron, maturase-specific domain